ncbi:hypothetical protein DPMN_121421 [Dreissena polymorpha]|uniref:Uncharacterized protein n=1 Tax=Dreissena polymorpha TaxID=45954 RepID=A0A9D4JR23_DREPO|nr:hypothetical protein DPMN_121421 [Dreissena polymorpha]
MGKDLVHNSGLNILQLPHSESQRLHKIKIKTVRQLAVKHLTVLSHSVLPVISGCQNGHDDISGDKHDTFIDHKTCLDHCLV